MLTLTEWCRKAVGVPFVPHGRDYDGWDCWGLCIAAYRDVLGVDLPDYTYESVRDYRTVARQFTHRAGAAYEPCDPHPMALAAIFRRGRVIHAGVVIAGRRIMHVEEGIETCAERVANLRVEGYYVPAGRTPARVQE